MIRLQNHYFILRHGQTNYHKDKPGIIYPKPDSPKVFLSKQGKKEIEKAAKKLKNRKINEIYSSDFFRTRQTAGIVAKKIGIKKINFNKKLRDVNLGIYHGRQKEEFYRLFPKDSMKRFIRRPKKGESWRDLAKRMVAFINEIDKKYRNENILIISHADPLMILKGKLQGLSEQQILKKRKELFPETGELKSLN